ncbi:hypothetical protein C8J55DRAFT_490355 [Lentinula edodes]|uniref:Uncharacterized protein n=1 Tax=Lentinula lateritia TaxID=40482 RepID=A0A9W9A881_9AGAR|nr:hypothetical protein C8J55DRAFT_490355 [Lentinula edodes]
MPKCFSNLHWGLPRPHPWGYLSKAIGQDTTLLGTTFDEEFEQVPPSSRPSDGRSLDSESSGGETSDEEPVGDFICIMHRLAQEAQALLPRLYGIDNALSDIQTLPSSPEILEFQQLIEKLSGRFSRLQSRDLYLPEATPHSGIAQNADVILTGVDGSSTGHKRKRVQRQLLRAPSPEAKQRRKSSNGTL